jgi:drug/metabolite transporter (DMT)-like permease
MTAAERARRMLLIGVLVGCGLAWGSTQSLGKVATSTGHPPLGLLFWQFVIGTALMGAAMVVRGTPPVLTRRALVFGVVVALVGSVLPGITFWTSVARLPAGVMSLIIATVPMMAFGLALLLGQDRLTPARLGGVLAGLAGVLLIALPEASLPEAGQAAFLPLALLGPFLYACETNFVQRFGMAGDGPVPGDGAGVGDRGAGGAAARARLGPVGRPGGGLGRAEGAFVAGSVTHVVTYAAFVWLAANAGSTFASQCSYVVTASGLVWAAALLGERVPPTVGLALLCLLAGLALVRPREAGHGGGEGGARGMGSPDSDPHHAPQRLTKILTCARWGVRKRNTPQCLLGKGPS